MAKPISASVLVHASVAQTWDTYFDSSRWRSWVDGFASVVAEDGFPRAGGTLTWRSLPAGRGEVNERVLEHEQRRRHRVEFRDPTMEGELETTFAIEGDATRVAQELHYRVRERGPMTRFASLFFVKGQLGESMRRTLEGLKRETEAVG